MIRNVSGLVFMAALAAISIGCATGNGAAQAAGGEITDLSDLPKNKRGYAEIKANQLQSLLEEKNFLLVNVNGAALEIIPGTDFTVPFDQLEDNLDRFTQKDRITVLYCQAGPLSRSAAQDLVDLGFTNVIWLDGGISAWKRAGFDIEAR